MKFIFSENNSGGKWWLKRTQYESLFKSGWVYEPKEYQIKNGYDKKSFYETFFTAKLDLFPEVDDVPYGWRLNLVGEFNSMEDAIENWENTTGRDINEQGCSCCGNPFSIYEY